MISTPRLRTALRAAFLVALLLAFTVALLPAPAMPELIAGQDKIGHFAAFAALGLLGFSAWPARPGTVFVALLAYGYAIEVAQSLTTHRTGDASDWLADAAGAGTAFVVHRMWQKAKSRSRG
jgi:VanZ family protein